MGHQCSAHLEAFGHSGATALPRPHGQAAAVSLAFDLRPSQVLPMPASAPDKRDARSLLKRMLANTAWLVGGKGFGAGCSLVYLAILARSLGLKDFGHFSLIWGAAQALVAITGFQTWRAVVRYGAAHVHERNWEAFGRISMLAAMLDLAGALLGCAVAYLVYFHLNEALGLNPAFQTAAFLFTCAMLFSAVSAPSGVARALDRFDMAVYVEAVIPTGRLILAVLIWFTGPSVFRFLFAWAIVDLIQAVVYWTTVRRLCPQAVRSRYLNQWRRAEAENPGVGKFFLVAYAAATTESLMRYGPLLAAGSLVGTRAAGLYRMAQQLSQGLSKLSALLTRAAYAEINRAHVTAGPAEFRKLVLHTSLLGAVAGIAIVLLAVLLGRPLLEGIGGREFRVAYGILVLLTVAASFELASVAFEPVLHSTGRATHALIARLLGLVTLAIGAVSIFGTGKVERVAMAVALGAAVTYVALGLIAWRALKRLDQVPEIAPEEADSAAMTPGGR